MLGAGGGGETHLCHARPKGRRGMFHNLFLLLLPEPQVLQGVQQGLDQVDYKLNSADCRVHQMVSANTSVHHHPSKDCWWKHSLSTRR